MLLDFENLELRAAIIDLRAHLAMLKLEQALWDYGDYLEEKYRADQPRAPKGTPEGGRWIDDAGSAQQQGLADERVRVAQRRDPSFYYVDLEKEGLENPRSHAFSKHVGRADADLIDELNKHHHFVQVGDRLGVRYQATEGRFLTPGQANNFVAEILRMNPEKVEEAVAGNPRITLSHYFGFQTGVEAFRAHDYAIPIIRPTYSVRVLIAYEKRNDRGYVVITAFPMNDFPNETFLGENQDGH